VSRPRRSPLPLLGGLLALYLAYPLVAFAIRIATSRGAGFSTPGLGDALYISAATATISLALISIFGIPLAYVLARSRGRFAAFVGLVAQLPLALPPLMSGILLIYIVGPYTAIGRLFGGRLTETMAGVVIAQTFVAAPFLVTVAKAAFSDLDPHLLDVAATLGLREVPRFFRVALPGAAHGIRAGMLLAWLRAFGEYGATVILAYHPYSLPVFTYLQFSGTGLPTTEAPTALALAVAAIVILLTRVRIRLPGRRNSPLPAVVMPSTSPQIRVRFSFALGLGDFHLNLVHAAQSANVAILGASGSGKSVTLRCIAGIYGAKPGPVWFGEQLVTDIPVEARHVGYVSQTLSLFPNRQVWDQLLFGVDADPGLAAYWLERLHLSELARRLPIELSGGQRQRVCLAQALARRPALLLLDEPFSALDAPVREDLRLGLRALQRETGLATVLVTHDPEEAAMLAEEILVIGDGHLLQAGRRSELFQAPNSPAVARLLGAGNILSGIQLDGGHIGVENVAIATSSGDRPVGSSVTWSIRPEHVRVGPDGDYAGVVRDVIDRGNATEILVGIGPQHELRARTTSTDLVVGDGCFLDLPGDAIHVWSADDAS
jgi:molybdate transport system permease protein